MTIKWPAPCGPLHVIPICDCLTFILHSVAIKVWLQQPHIICFQKILEPGQIHTWKSRFQLE